MRHAHLLHSPEAFPDEMKMFDRMGVIRNAVIWRHYGTCGIEATLIKSDYYRDTRSVSHVDFNA